MSGMLTLLKSKNMLYMGSTVVYGRGRAVVTAIGMATEMGKIARALQEVSDEKTPLQIKLNQLSKVLTWLVLLICGFVFIIQLIRARDNYTCQICGAKTTKNKKVELEVHHIRPKSMGGTDDETNLVTLCKSCHDKVHKGKLVINDQNIRDTENLKYASHMNIICSQLCKRYTEAEKTYGYITKLNRELLGLPKNHCNDACVIASGGEPFVASQYKYVKRCVPKGRYSLTILKGGKVIFRPTGKKCGFRNNDKVKYKGKTFYVSGPMKTGYCDLRDLEGNKINHKELYDTTYCKLKDLKRLNRPRTTLCSQTRV